MFENSSIGYEKIYNNFTDWTLVSLANTRSPEAPATAGIDLHVSPRPASASCACPQPTHEPARLYVSQPLLSDECPPTCSTGSLAGSLLDMAITSVADTFSVTFCR